MPPISPTPIRPRYLRTRQVWRLYRRDRQVPFASGVDELLTEIERDPAAIFWG
jgi:hypothetical protein